MPTKRKVKAKSKHKAKARSKTGRTTTRTGIVPRPATTNPFTSPDFKTCEEIEVGDIGGFGVTSEERMERETRCTQRATQFCKSCSRNLCNTHYELLHKDHDNMVKLGSGPNPVQL